MIIAALIIGWLFLGSCGGVLLWFCTEHERSGAEYRVRASDLRLFCILSVTGPVGLAGAAIFTSLNFLDRWLTLEGDRVVFTLPRKVK